MSEQVLANRAVEVLLDRGAGYSPRWTVGSGFLIGRTRVLTAAHNVGEGKLSVRVAGGTEYAATIAQVGDVEQGLDLAVVNIADTSFCDAPEAIVQFAKLDRSKPGLLEKCWAIGFPRFKEKELTSLGGSRLRDTIQIDGEIPLGSNVISGMLELRVTATPQASPSLGSSEWEGMSGAMVFTNDPVHGDQAIGIIIEHHLPEGTSSLTVIPITAISDRLDEPTARQWWNLLGVVDPHELPHLPVDLQRELVAAEKTYRSQVIKKYNSLSFSWFEHDAPSFADVPLEDIFVRLTLTVEKVIREPIPPEESSKQKRSEERPREPVITVQEPIKLDQALTRHLLIVGEPGAGKSTLLRWLAVTFAQGRQREPDRLGPSADVDLLPVLIELGHLPERYLRADGGETPNWIEFLPDHITKGEMAFTAIPPQLLTQALTTGRCLLLFDGLDEVASRQARIRLTESLAELARLFPGNRVVIGSRPAGASESMLPSLFRQSHITPFTSADVQRLFRFWYALAGDKRLTDDRRQAEADALYARVQAAPATLRLATTPLLSTILVLIWHQEGVLPERRVELYERYCRILIEQWEWVKKAHAVVYPKELDDMDWEDHVRLLMPIAYAIHSQEQSTSATKDDLVDLLARTLPTLGYADEQTAKRIAKQFFATLGLRSGLLQYIGKDEKNNGLYGFPHQTFQEYLAARYIAAQPDPEYIDLVMAHLHEAWWREVHLLTIGLLGSGGAQEAREVEAKTEKASALILTILRLYKPPSWILRSSRKPWVRMISPGKFFPQVQLERRFAWILAREFELAVKGYAECDPDVMTAMVYDALSDRAASLAQDVLHDEDRYWLLLHRNDHYWLQGNLLDSIGQFLQQKRNKAIVSMLLEMLKGKDPLVRLGVERILGQPGTGDEVVSTLLEALHDENRMVRMIALKSLGQSGTESETVISALLEALHDEDRWGRLEAAESLARLGVGNEAVVSALLEALHQGGVARLEAAESLARLGVGNEAVVSALLEALRDGDLSEWRLSPDPDLAHSTLAVAASLAQLGRENEAIVSALLEELDGKDDGVRLTAATSLRQLGKEGEIVARALVEVMHNEEPNTRRAAAELLGQLEIGNEAIASALLERLHDTSREVALTAVTSLGRVGVKSEVVVNALLELPLKNSGGPLWSTHANPLLLLARLVTGRVLTLRPLERMLSLLRRTAAASLARLGTGSETIVHQLVAALDSEQWEVQLTAAESLAQLGEGNEMGVSTLLKALHDKNRWFVRQTAAESLGQMRTRDETVERALLEALHDENKVVQLTAAESLARLGVGNEKVVRKLLKELPYEYIFQEEELRITESLLQLKNTANVQSRKVFVLFNSSLHSRSPNVRRIALMCCNSLLNGHPFPGYRWVSLQVRRAQRLRLKSIAFGLGVVAALLLIVLGSTWLFGYLDPNGFVMRYLGVLAVFVTFAAAITQIRGRSLRDPWERR